MTYWPSKHVCVHRHFASTIKRPFEVRYDPYTQTVQVIDNKDTLLNLTDVIKGDVQHLRNVVARLDHITTK